VAGVVVLDGAALTALLTLAISGTGNSGNLAAAVIGIVCVAVVGTVVLAAIAKARAEVLAAALLRADRAADAALLSRQMAGQCRTYSQAQLDAVDVSPSIAFDHGPVRSLGSVARTSYVGMPMSRPQLVVGQGFTERVDHDMGLRLAYPRAS
jgi:hypothetical protein